MAELAEADAAAAEAAVATMPGDEDPLWGQDLLAGLLSPDLEVHSFSEGEALLRQGERGVRGRRGRCGCGVTATLAGHFQQTRPHLSDLLFSWHTQTAGCDMLYILEGECEVVYRPSLHDNEAAGAAAADADAGAVTASLASPLLGSRSPSRRTLSVDGGAPLSLPRLNSSMSLVSGSASLSPSPGPCPSPSLAQHSLPPLPNGSASRRGSAQKRGAVEQSPRVLRWSGEQQRNTAGDVGSSLPAAPRSGGATTSAAPAAAGAAANEAASPRLGPVQQTPPPQVSPARRSSSCITVPLPSEQQQQQQQPNGKAEQRVGRQVDDGSGGGDAVQQRQEERQRGSEFSFAASVPPGSTQGQLSVFVPGDNQPETPSLGSAIAASGGELAASPFSLQQQQQQLVGDASEQQQVDSDVPQPADWAEAAQQQRLSEQQQISLQQRRPEAADNAPPFLVAAAAHAREAVAELQRSATEYLLARRCQGDVVGEMELLRGPGARRAASVIAAAPQVRVAHLPHAAARAYLANRPLARQQLAELAWVRQSETLVLEALTRLAAVGESLEQQQQTAANGSVVGVAEP